MDTDSEGEGKRKTQSEGQERPQSPGEELAVSEKLMVHFIFESIFLETALFKEPSVNKVSA